MAGTEIEYSLGAIANRMCDELAEKAQPFFEGKKVYRTESNDVMLRESFFRRPYLARFDLTGRMFRPDGIIVDVFNQILFGAAQEVADKYRDMAGGRVKLVKHYVEPQATPAANPAPA